MTTIFNPENKKELTFREILGPAMKITDEEDAKQYLRSYIDYIQKYLDKNPFYFRRDDNKTALDIAKENLGYYAGYYDNETRKRVEKLFMCSHPVFGSIAKNGEPTPEQAFEMGKKLGKKSKKK